MEPIVFLNNQYLPISQAFISVMDRGFLLADSIYDGVMVYNGKPFHAQKHIDRLRRNLEKIEIQLTQSDDFLLNVINELITRNAQHTEQTFYIQVSRGVSSDRSHHYQEKIEPTLFAKLSPTSKKDLHLGIKAITTDDIRWQHCEIKCSNRLANVIMSQEAHNAGAEEAIIINHGHAVEGATSNVFIVEQGKIYTPPLSNQVLDGITRGLVCTLCSHHATLIEEPITRERLLKADEVWISSSSRKIAPVVHIDKTIIGDGKPGAVYQAILKAYDAEISSIIAGDS